MPPSIKPLRIYAVNLDFPPVGGPGVWRILAMVKYAALAGHKVKVFCSDRASWHSRTDASLLKQLPEGVEVVRVHAWFLTDTLAWLNSLAHSVQSPQLRRLILAFRWRLDYYWPDSVLYWATKTAMVAIWHARRDSPDCIFTTGPQHLSHLTGYLLRKWFKTVWIMDYRDPWTCPAETHELVAYQPKLFAWLEGKFIMEANAVTVVTPTWLNEIKKKFYRAGLKDKFHLLRNGHDLPDEDGKQGEEQLAESVNRPLKVHFNGTIQSNNNLLRSLEAAIHHLQGEGVNPQTLLFSFCGLPGDFKDSLLSSPYVSCFLDYGPMDHGKSLACCQEADALLVMVQTGVSALYRGAIPGKTYEALALGKHIFAVLPAQCDTRELLNDYPNATLTTDTDVDSITEGIRALIKLFEASGRRIPLVPLRRRQDLAKQYSRRSQADQLIQIMRMELADLPMESQK